MASNILKKIDGLLLLFVLISSLATYTMDEKALKALRNEIKSDNTQAVSEILKQYPGAANVLEKWDYPQGGALHVAALFSNEAMVTLLITEGEADIELKNDPHLDFTPIIPAIFALHNTLGRLIDHGARVNVHIKPERKTPLHTAVEVGRRDSVRTLLEAGASRDAIDSEGNKPMDYLSRCSDPVAAAKIEHWLRNFQGPALPDAPQ
jgi:hypothetical protein